MRTLICTLMVLGWAGTALAGDGNRLLEICKAPEGSLSRSNCLGYVTGISDALIDLAAMGTLKVYPCLPRVVTAVQLADVVVKYVSENPKDRSYTGSSLVIGALLDAWPPCPKPEK
jgi:hypothetical protein